MDGLPIGCCLCDKKCNKKRNKGVQSIESPIPAAPHVAIQARYIAVLHDNHM
jgi:hypothetical protein